MRNPLVYVITGLTAAGFGGAFANDDESEREQSARIGAFEDYDVDRDQRISREEARDGELETYFIVLDSDRDGFVDETELEENRQRVDGEDVQQELEQGYEEVEYDPEMQGAARSAATGQTRDTQGFDVYDTNSDGRISREEARRDEALTSHFIVWDKDDDGYVDENEFSEGEEARGKPEDRAGLNGTNGEDTQGGATTPEIARNDRDGDGRISAEEARGSAELQDEFETLDANNDDYLDANEIRYDPSTRRGDGSSNFRSIDVNQDGYLARSEAASDSYVDANFENWDINGDGVLDEGELDNDWAEWDRDSFDAIDSNADGIIDADEASESGYVDYNFDTWDLDQDGALSEEEVNAGWMDDDAFNGPAWF